MRQRYDDMLRSNTIKFENWPVEHANRNAFATRVKSTDSQVVQFIWYYHQSQLYKCCDFTNDFLINSIIWLNNFVFARFILQCSIDTTDIVFISFNSLVQLKLENL